MICCAIAMVIVSQIYLTLATIREFLFGTPAPRATATNGAASWHRGAGADTAGPAARTTSAGLLALTPRRLLAAVLVASLGLVVAVVAVRNEAIASADAFAPTAADICRWLPFDLR